MIWPTYFIHYNFNPLWRGVIFWGDSNSKGGKIFWGYKFEGGQNFLAYENVSICNGYRVSDIFWIGDKILQVG